MLVRACELLSELVKQALTVGVLLQTQYLYRHFLPVVCAAVAVAKGTRGDFLTELRGCAVSVRSKTCSFQDWLVSICIAIRRARGAWTQYAIHMSKEHARKGCCGSPAGALEPG